MGNYALVLAAGAVLAVSMLMMSSRKSTQGANDALTENTFKTIGREAAMTGLNMTARRLVADTDSWLTDPTLY